MNPQQRNFLQSVFKKYPHLFRPDFREWLESNFHVWQRFAMEADKLREQGRTHYSARTIMEVLRHQTALRECGSDFKISNNYIPDLARLYVFTRHCHDFFSIKARIAA